VIPLCGNICCINSLSWKCQKKRPARLTTFYKHAVTVLTLLSQLRNQPSWTCLGQSEDLYRFKNMGKVLSSNRLRTLAKAGKIYCNYMWISRQLPWEDSWRSNYKKDGIFSDFINKNVYQTEMNRRKESEGLGWYYQEILNLPLQYLSYHIS
jgi:hypothetical protein